MRNKPIWRFAGAIAAIAVWITATNQFADASSYWEHNGSIVNLQDKGNGRWFYYHTPRSGLAVQSGTLLFEGRKDGSTYAGTAYVFSPTCGKSGYPVKGVVSRDQTSIRLYGKAPRRDSNCNVTGYRNDELVFTYRSRAAPPASQQPSLAAPGRIPNPPRDLSVGDVSEEAAREAAELLADSFKCPLPNTRGEAASGGQRIHTTHNVSTNIQSFQITSTTVQTSVGRWGDTTTLHYPGGYAPGAPLHSSEDTYESEYRADYRDLVANASAHDDPAGLTSGGAAHYVTLYCRQNKDCFRRCEPGGCRNGGSDLGLQICTKESVEGVRQAIAILVAFNRNRR
jgi:hypothetical protein